MPVDFSFSNIMAGIVFGSFGLYVFKIGKQKSHAVHIVIGLTLMIYPYFVSNEWINWGIGSGLLFAAYKLKN
jgi:hypothetical protein